MRLPAGLSRTILAGPHGPLELLSSTVTSTSRPPLLFLHGGFHSAICFRLWMQYLSSHHQLSCYSLSLTSHGQSHHSNALRTMTRTAQAFCGDLQTGIAHVRKVNNVSPIVCGHSAGGGLSQYFLASPAHKQTEVAGLITLAAFPPSGPECVPHFGLPSPPGGLPVFRNWAKLDPALLLRTLKMGFHPRAALATPALMTQAFFSDAFAQDHDSVMQAWSELEPLESMLWPARLAVPFADAAVVKARVGGRVAVIGGALDRLMTPQVVRSTARQYGVDANIVEGNAHDLMLDKEWRNAADVVAHIVNGWF